LWKRLKNVERSRQTLQVRGDHQSFFDLTKENFKMAKPRSYKVTFYFNSHDDHTASKTVLSLEKHKQYLRLAGAEDCDFKLRFTELRDGINNLLSCLRPSLCGCHLGHVATHFRSMISKSVFWYFPRVNLWSRRAT
jgi:hypothetical protein